MGTLFKVIYLNIHVFIYFHSLLHREPSKHAKISNCEISSMGIFPSYKNSTSWPKRMWYSKVVCIHIASSVIAIITIHLSTKYHQHPSCQGSIYLIIFYFFESPGCLLWSLWSKGFVPSMHSKRWDLSCHSRWLSMIVYLQRKLAFYGHSGSWKIAGSLWHGLLFHGVSLSDRTLLRRRAIGSGKRHQVLQFSCRSCDWRIALESTCLIIWTAKVRTQRFCLLSFFFL